MQRITTAITATIALAMIFTASTSTHAALSVVADYDFDNNAAPAGFTDFGTPTYAGGQIVLNGTSGLSNVATPLSATDNFVIEAIVNATSFAGFDFVVANSVGAANSGYGILHEAGWEGIHMGTAKFGSTASALNTPVSIAIVRESGVSSLYVNGVASGALGSVPATPTQINIGYNPSDGAAGGFNGSIDRVRLSTFTTFNAADLLAAPMVLADLSDDYLDAASVGDTSDGTGISGTTTGTWHYHQDTNTDPTDGGLTLLTFDTGLGTDSATGYKGTGSVFGFDAPLISDDALFDGASVPAGTLAAHPGHSSEGAEFLVVEYRATENLTGVFLDFTVNQANAGGDGIDWRILDDAGDVLFSGTEDGTSTVGVKELIDNINAGESIWLVIGNGPVDDGGGDQTFIDLTLTGSIAVPTPSALPAGLAMLGLAAMRRRRR